MIFYFLVSIVFIAEIVLTIFLFTVLCKFDKSIIEYDSLLKDLKPSIREILNTYKNLSKELLNLAPAIALKIKSIFKDIFIGQLKSIIGALTFWLVKKEVEKHN